VEDSVLQQTGDTYSGVTESETTFVRSRLGHDACAKAGTVTLAPGPYKFTHTYINPGAFTILANAQGDFKDNGGVGGHTKGDRGNSGSWRCIERQRQSVSVVATVSKDASTKPICQIGRKKDRALTRRVVRKGRSPRLSFSSRSKTPRVHDRIQLWHTTMTTPRATSMGQPNSQNVKGEPLQSSALRRTNSAKPTSPQAASPN
jgi:hypothetical protein